MKLFILLGLIATTAPVYAQTKIKYSGGSTCADMKPFCITSTSTYEFEMTSANILTTTDTSDDFGCLEETPGEQWLYMTVGTGGNIDLTTTSFDDHDVALWGPFNSYDLAVAGCGSLSAPISCSGSASASEVLKVTGATAGQVYIFVLTNYAETEQDLTSSLGVDHTAELDCAAVEGKPSVANVIGSSSSDSSKDEGKYIVLFVGVFFVLAAIVAGVLKACNCCCFAGAARDNDSALPTKEPKTVSVEMTTA